MKERLVSVETITLAREKGWTGDRISQPLIQRWLDEYHNVHIYVKYTGTKYFVYWKQGDESHYQIIKKNFFTYEDALESGIQRGIKNIDIENGDNFDFSAAEEYFEQY